MASDFVFILQHIHKNYGAFPALHDVSLQIRAGERVALVGPSGAGKSTLINLLNGSLVPDAGQLTALGQDMVTASNSQLRQIQQQVGTIYQQFHLVGNLRVVHNVNAGHLGRWSWWQAAASLIRPLEVAAAAQALTQVGIPEKLYERTDQLSGGQQQRVALARVLVQNPQAILADEPVASLDPERSREIMDLLFQLTQQMDKTLVVSLHDIDYAFRYCERMVGLREGQVLFDAEAAAVTPDMVQELYRLE